MRWVLGSVMRSVCWVVLIGGGLLFVPCGEGGFRVDERGNGIWEASGGGWQVFGIGVWPMNDIVRVVDLKPREADAARLYEVIVDEPGEWFAFGIKFGAAERVVWTKSTKIVLTDKQGKHYESEACFFYPDKMQTQVYDCRKMNVVVTPKTVYCNPKRELAVVAVKFALGSVRRKDVVKFEVVGAVEVPPRDTTK